MNEEPTLFGIPIKVDPTIPADEIRLGYVAPIPGITAAEAAESFHRFAETLRRECPGGLIDAWGMDIARRLRGLDR